MKNKNEIKKEKLNEKENQEMLNLTSVIYILFLAILGNLINWWILRGM